MTGDRPAGGELAAVGVLTAFRRRGIASALSAYLARTAHPQAISLVFLETEPEEEQIYRRTGFTAKLWASIRRPIHRQARSREHPRPILASNTRPPAAGPELMTKPTSFKRC